MLHAVNVIIIITPLIIIKDQRKENVYTLHLHTYTQVHTHKRILKALSSLTRRTKVSTSTSERGNYIFNFHRDELRVTFSSSSYLKLMNAD